MIFKQSMFQFNIGRHCAPSTLNFPPIDRFAYTRHKKSHLYFQTHFLSKQPYITTRSQSVYDTNDGDVSDRKDKRLKVSFVLGPCHIREFYRIGVRKQYSVDMLQDNFGYDDEDSFVEMLLWSSTSMRRSAMLLFLLPFSNLLFFASFRFLVQAIIPLSVQNNLWVPRCWQPCENRFQTRSMFSSVSNSDVLQP